jgi:hypothetical protein
MATKTGLSRPLSTLNTLEHKLEEIAEVYSELAQLRVKLLRSKRGGERYFDLLPDISVAAGVLGDKCGSLEKITDEIMESLPDED